MMGNRILYDGTKQYFLFVAVSNYVEIYFKNKNTNAKATFR